MNCSQSQRLLSLYRNGELSNDEAKALVTHTRECEHCRLELERLMRLDAAIGRIRSFVPRLENPDTMVASILAGIHPSRRIAERGVLDRILDVFDLPGLRLAAASFILLATGTFLFQYFTLFSGIHALESEAGSRVATTSRTGSYIAVQSPEAVQIAQSTDVRNLIPAGELEIVDGQIRVQQSNVASLLSTYGLRNLTSVVASSVLHIDKTKLDAVINDVTKHASIVTDSGR